MEEDSVKSLLRLAQKDEKNLIQLINEKIKNDQELNNIKIKYEVDKKVLTSELNDFKNLVKTYDEKIRNLESIIQNKEINEMQIKVKNQLDDRLNTETYQTLKNVWNSLVHLQKTFRVEMRKEVSSLVFDEKDIKSLFSKLLEYISEDYQEFQKEIGKLQRESNQYKLQKEKYQGFDKMKEEMISRHQSEIKLIEKQKENLLEKNTLLESQINEIENKLKIIQQEKHNSTKQLENRISSLSSKNNEQNKLIEQLKWQLAENQPSQIKQHLVQVEKEQNFEQEKLEYLEKLRVSQQNEILKLKSVHEKKQAQIAYEFNTIIAGLEDQIQEYKSKLAASQQHIQNLNELLNQTSTLTEKEQILIEQINQLEKQNQSLCLALQQSKDNTIDLQITNNKLESELSHNKILAEELNNTIQDFRLKYDNNSENYIHKQKQLESEKSALIMQINELNSKMVLVLEENIDRVRKDEKVKREDQLTEQKMNHLLEINLLNQKHEQKILDLKDQLRAKMEELQQKITQLEEYQAKMKELFEKEVAKYQEQIDQSQKEESLKQLEMVRQEREKDRAIIVGENEKFRERVRKRVLEDAKNEARDEVVKLKQMIKEWEYKYNSIEEKLSNQHKIQAAKTIQQYEQQIIDTRKIHEMKQGQLEENLKIVQEEKLLLSQQNTKLEQQMKAMKLENMKFIEQISTYKKLNEELIKSYEQLKTQEQIKAIDQEKEVEKLCSEIKEVKGKVTEAYEEQYNYQLEEQQIFVKNMEKSVNELQNLHKQEVRDLKEQIKELQILFNLRPSKTEDIKTINFLQEDLQAAQKKISQFELEYQNIKKTYDVFKPLPQPLSQHAALHSILNNIQLNSSQIIIPNLNTSIQFATSALAVNNNNTSSSANQQSRNAITPIRTQHSPTTNQINSTNQQKRIQSSLSNYKLNLSSTEDLIYSQQKKQDKDLFNLNRTSKEGEFLLNNDILQSKTSTNMFKGSNIKKYKRTKRIKTEQDEEDENEENIQNIIINNKDQSRIGRLFKEGSLINSSLDKLIIKDPQSPLKNNLIQQRLKGKAGVKLTIQDAIYKKNFVGNKDKQNPQTAEIFMQESDQNMGLIGISHLKNQKSVSLNPRNYTSTVKRPRINTASNLVEKNQYQMQKNSVISRKIRDEQLKYLSMTRPMSSLDFEH